MAPEATAPEAQVQEEAGEQEDASDAVATKEDKPSQIKSLIEFYFGDANFRRDKFMQNEAAKDNGECLRCGVLMTAGV